MLAGRMVMVTSAEGTRAMPRQIETDEVYVSTAPYSQAMVHGDTVYVAGQVPVDPDGNIVEGDVQRQADQVFTNMSTILETAGSSMEELVKVTVFLTDIEDFDAFNETYREWVPTPRPARSAVEVADLAIDVEVEVEAIAAL